MTPLCDHLALVHDVAPEDPRVCEDCIREGTRWHHLRMCRTCGQMGCFDNSPRRHARAHAEAEGHPVMRSMERGEGWTWCFADERAYRDVPGGGFRSADLYLEGGIDFARAHLREGGDLPVAADFRTPEGFPLGDWIRYAVERLDEDEIGREDRAALSMLPGWPWREVSPA
jgi:hypothetical protein